MHWRAWQYMWSIPAYAGDPGVNSWSAPYRSVYPRLRGGSAIPTLMGEVVFGLSPPTRGIRPLLSAIFAESRSIPAYAGDPGLS